MPLREVIGIRCCIRQLPRLLRYGAAGERYADIAATPLAIRRAVLRAEYYAGAITPPRHEAWYAHYITPLRHIIIALITHITPPLVCHWPRRHCHHRDYYATRAIRHLRPLRVTLIRQPLSIFQYIEPAGTLLAARQAAAADAAAFATLSRRTPGFELPRHA